MSKTVTIQFTVTTPYQVSYEVENEFQLSSTEVQSAIRELSYYLDRDILNDFDEAEDKGMEEGEVVYEKIGIDYIEIKNSNLEIETLIEGD